MAEQGKKTRKHGRNEAKCTRYAASYRRTRNGPKRTRRSSEQTPHRHTHRNRNAGVIMPPHAGFMDDRVVRITGSWLNRLPLPMRSDMVTDVYALAIDNGWAIVAN